MISFLVPTAAVIAVAMVSCVILAVFMVLSDDTQKSVLGLLCRNISIYLFPLMVAFVFLFIVWGVRILM